MLFLGILAAYLLFAIAIGKLLAYASRQDEVWTDIRENVIRPVPVPGTPVEPAGPRRRNRRQPAARDATRPVREKLPL